ncbi:polymeric immunoglobulin receptor-like [Pimephales promelas]|uniref:polymeric immunoglobulin receptor-like n=1 Tax=Pimephales promelas TaxID=90988 RepID=UPI001955A472|nr:polymeric immunoglobulin receptor-like [Pimephales promelas]
MKIIWTFTLMMIPGVVSSMSVTGYSGGGVNITCEYDKGYTENKKYFCKREWPSCKDQIKTDNKDTWVHNGRFSLYDDTSSAVFTVTIRNLTEEDSGKYYCGVDIPTGIDSSTEVNLVRKKDSTTPTLSSSSSSSSLVICVTVILLLLIIGFMFCIVTLYKKHQTRDCDSASKTSETGAENSEAVPQPLYEEIKDTRPHTDCRNTPLPITPSDSSRPVYDTAKLPTNPSVEWHKWDKNQLPTNPSDSCVVSSMSVTGYSGGGVNITCEYDEKYKENTKYFCKGDWLSCIDRIKTDIKDKWVHNGRFSLYDDTRSAVFTVTIRNLTGEDSGTYQCAVDIPKDIDSSTEVKLKISTGQQIRTVRGYSGGNIIIDYNYEMIHTNNFKKVCKTSSDQCFTVINTNRSTEWKRDRRFSAHDDRSAGLLRLFIGDLNENDSGEYKIIVKVSEDYSFFSEFDLDIKTDDCCEKSISLSASAGGSVNINCKYPQSHSGDVKFLCWRSGADLCAKETSVNESRRWRDEGKIQLYDDREQQLLTGSISHVTEQDSEYWCGVQSDQGHKIFITRVLIRVTDTSLIDLLVLVLVLLLLIITGLLVLFLCKKYKSQGGDSSSQTGPGNHEVVSHTAFEYEDIKDTHKQLPTNPSDYFNTVYATAQLPTNPSDSCNTVYATAQLPTNPSDSPHCVYTTVEKATGDSQCCITSAEDLNYAVVNFHMESDSPDSVSIRKNQDYSEYAAVNHLSA